jgi:hypothetical protein
MRGLGLVRRSYGDLVPQDEEFDVLLGRSSASVVVGCGVAARQAGGAGRESLFGPVTTGTQHHPASAWPSRPSDWSAPTPSVDHAGTWSVPNGQVNGCVQRFWHPQSRRSRSCLLRWGRENPSLRGAGDRVPFDAILTEDARFEERRDQASTRLSPMRVRTRLMRPAREISSNEAPPYYPCRGLAVVGEDHEAAASV